MISKICKGKHTYMYIIYIGVNNKNLLNNAQN
jgi:hypothetical protein